MVYAKECCFAKAVESLWHNFLMPIHQNFVPYTGHIHCFCGSFLICIPHSCYFYDGPQNDILITATGQIMFADR